VKVTEKVGNVQLIITSQQAWCRVSPVDVHEAARVI
jgi:hypothetical protein